MSNTPVTADQVYVEFNHYYRDVSHLRGLDLYRFFKLFEITDPCIQHAMKKLAAAGKRGAKDDEKDVREAIASLVRWQAMREEDKAATSTHKVPHP